ncbi:MAG: hypothetical protein K8R53_11405 [Bacteroidales bacterium]|nr:hypothetical protein [Bacteroidales bacterium]
MKLDNRINSFDALGNSLEKVVSENIGAGLTAGEKKVYDLIISMEYYNPWFTEMNVRMSVRSIALSLYKENIYKWIAPCKELLESTTTSITVGVVLAGNVPAVGFSDFLTVLISGHSFLGKLSSKDDKLLPAIANLLIEIEPQFIDYIQFTDERLENFDAIIATGSNNSSRYFDYYFSAYPHIIRKNRNGVAVIHGEERDEALQDLGIDVFSYFGLGCRNISKIYFPEGYKPEKLLDNWDVHNAVSDHHKYNNNYEYYKSIFLINQTPHLDNGFILFKEDSAIPTPVAVLNYEYYSSLGALEKKLSHQSENIQCIVGDPENNIKYIPFGQSQYPQLWDYADGVNTLEFLLKSFT